MSLSSVAVCCCLDQVGCESVISSSCVVVWIRLAVSLSSVALVLLFGSGWL